MAESKEEKKPTKAVTDTQNEVAGELASVLNKRFEQVSGQDKKEKGLGKFFSFGDSTKTILSSVEKSMFLQTSFLESINSTLKNSNLIAAEAREDEKRKDALSGIGDDDKPEKKDKELKSIFAAMSDKFKEGKEDFRKKASDTLLGDEDDSFLKKAGKVLATAYLGGKAVSGFVGNLADKAFNKLGFSDEKSKAMGETTGDAAGLGTGASVIAMSLKKFGLKGPGGLQAFATAAVSKITYDALGSLDVDGDGKILGVQKELVQGVGAGLAGVGTFIASGKAFGAVGKSLSKGFGAVKAKLGIKTKIPTPKAPGAPTGKAPKAPKLPTPKAPPTPKIPSALNVNTSGIANQGRPSTVKAVAERLKSINPSKLSKFSKFFKFAGPAAAIIPSLIDPALAIMNDAPDDVVKKEIAGALGSIGGATLGLLAGGALGTAIPIPFIGSGIGGFIGGIAGAFGGEYIAEKIADFFMGGPQVGKEEKKELEDAQKGGIGKKGKRGGSKKKPSEMVGAKITSAPSDEQRVADAQVNADATSKALADFESTAKSGRTVTEVDDFGFETTKTVFDDAKEQAQFDKLNAAKFDAENKLFDANNKLITGDEFQTAGMFEKLQFLQEKGFLPEGESQIEMGKFVGGPLSGMTPDEAISMYVAQQASTQKATAKFKDGKIPGKVTSASGDDMGLSVEEAEKQLADAKAAFAKAEEDGSISEGFTQDELQADIAFAEKDLRDANARAAASVAGIQSAPDKLMAKSKAISDDKATQDKQGKAVMMQNLNKGGDTITNTNKGGDSTTINVLKGGNTSLANAHIPVPQAI
jgi:hypothetical protein